MPIALAGVACENAAPTKSRNDSAASTDSIDQAWAEYRAYRTDSSRNRIITHYMRGHVRRIAERMRSHLPGQVEVDDLAQQGYLGLVDAIDRFDENRGVKFETFSSRRIYGAMQDYLRATDPVPRLMRSRSKRMLAAVEDFRKQHGRAPDANELSVCVEMPEATVLQVLTRGLPAATVSFNGAQTDVDSSDESDAMDGFEDHESETPLRAMEERDLRRWLTHGFDRRDRLIVILYYYESMTMKEIGVTLGCSESRVSQRLDSIVRTLRSRLNEQDMEREFFH
jgi:RNA polymerase sigma factor for flagellar operon FliA